jgi:hypothetical protein
MDEEMVHVIVRTKDGMVQIEQPDPALDTYPIIIHPDQVPVLIKWLEEAREELNHEHSLG